MEIIHTTSGRIDSQHFPFNDFLLPLAADGTRELPGGLFLMTPAHERPHWAGKGPASPQPLTEAVHAYVALFASQETKTGKDNR